MYSQCVQKKIESVGNQARQHSNVLSGYTSMCQQFPSHNQHGPKKHFGYALAFNILGVVSLIVFIRHLSLTFV